jgi:hypothetical protein
MYHGGAEIANLTCTCATTKISYLIAKLSGHHAAVPGPGNFCVQLLLEFLDKGTSRQGPHVGHLLSSILFSIVNNMRDSSLFRMAFPGPFGDGHGYCISGLQAYR